MGLLPPSPPSPQNLLTMNLTAYIPPDTSWEQWTPYSSHVLEQATSTHPTLRGKEWRGHGLCLPALTWEDGVGLCVYEEFDSPYLPSLEASRSNGWEAQGLEGDCRVGSGTGGGQRWEAWCAGVEMGTSQEFS